MTSKKLILIACFFLSSYTLQAWSLKTHLYIAQLVLNDVLDDGKLYLAGNYYDVPKHIYNALKNYPDKFRMGSLGPDVFPDFIVGQMTTHPGIPDGWKTDDWLKHLLGKAKTGEEIAFCYGYVVHASSDIFAHTYVNMFAGDVFTLFDKERTVELRHFMLEKFIEKYTPPIKDNAQNLVSTYTSLSSPLSFLSSTLILNEDVFKQHELDGVNVACYHLHSMFKVYKTVTDLKKLTDEIFRILRSFRLGRLVRADQLDKAMEKRYVAITDAYDKHLYDSSIIPKKKQAEVYKAAKLMEDQNKDKNEFDQAMLEIQEADELSGNVNGITKLINSWLASIQNSAMQYIQAGDSAGIRMLNGAGNPITCYTDWAKCYAWSFVAVPDVIPGTWCFFTNYFDSIKKEMEKLLPQFIVVIFEKIDAFKKYVRNSIKPALLKTTELLVTKRMHLDAESVDLAYYMIYAGEITKEKLDMYYRQDASGKHLIKYKNVSDYILKDMALRSGSFSPTDFGPMANSITLSKLALLDPKALNDLISDHAGKSQSVLYGSPVYPDSPGNYTILFDAVMSIDGNHQWQPYPLPYPREIFKAKKDTFGYDYYTKPSEKKGFKIWVDPTLRTKVFFKLFNKSAMGSVAADLNLKNYPYPECELNPFPSTLDINGKPVDRDTKCLEK